MEKGGVIRYWRDRGGWATAIYVRTCERGRKFGLWECDASEGRKIYVRPDEVKIWEEIRRGT